jgi:hypothetical protein
MRERREDTSRMRRGDLAQLVAAIGAREPQITVRMKQPTLDELLQRERDLSAAPGPLTEITERMRAHARERKQLVLLFVSAVFAGVLLTMPFWW